MTHSQIHGSPVSKLFRYKVSGEFLRQDSQSLYSFGKIQNVGEKELSEEKKFSVSLEKDFIFRFHIYFSASFASYFQQLKQLLSTEWLNITLLNFVRLSTLSIKKGSHKRYMQHSQLQQQFEHSGPSRSSFDLSCTDKPAKSKTAAVYRLIEYIYIYLYKYIYI